MIDLKKPSLFLVLLIVFGGCQKRDENTVVKKKPRPVEVQLLSIQAPPAASRYSAVVASWKTEDIGMEVGGRIEWVAEPNTSIEARVVNTDGTTKKEGTPIARLDRQRFDLQVETAKSEVDRANRSIEAAEIEINDTIPSQIRAATIDKERAKTEYERSVKLVKQNAGAQADADRDYANWQNAVAQLEQLQAQLKSKEADLSSLRSAKKQAEQSVLDAIRDSDDCVLYASYDGQISDVVVVPGSVVSAGQAIATLQMMDPIKIELEVSAKESRRIRNRQRLPVIVTNEDGTVSEEDGFLYLVDPVADSQTRTFTLTLLMTNEKLAKPGDDKTNLATTNQAWRVDFQFVPGAEEGKLYAPKKAIRNDIDGPFVWRVTNLTKSDSLPKNNILKVEKMRIVTKATELPFLGNNWTFQEIEIEDPTFDPSKHLIAGQLVVEDGNPDAWSGSEILVKKTQGQWRFRPGDLVQVDLSDNEAEPGIFVPMDAISRSQGDSFLFLVDEQEGEKFVRRTPVEILNSSDSRVSSMLQIQLPDDPAILLGKRYVTKGTHYLRDGESVRIVSSESSQ